MPVEGYQCAGLEAHREGVTVIGSQDVKGRVAC